MEAVPYNPYNGGRSVRHWQAPSVSVGRNPRFTPPPGYMSPGADPDSPPFSAGNPQAIDLRKIYWNHDMRTTVSLCLQHPSLKGNISHGPRREQVMLRNIPFTMTWVQLSPFLLAVWPLMNSQVELKDILDATNANRFDFLYLRMGQYSYSEACVKTKDLF